MGLKIHACVGGTAVRDDIRTLQDGVHIVVGTPGRVYDMIQRRALRLESVQLFGTLHFNIFNAFNSLLSSMYEAETTIDWYLLMNCTPNAWRKIIQITFSQTYRISYQITLHKIIIYSVISHHIASHTYSYTYSRIHTLSFTHVHTYLQCLTRLMRCFREVSRSRSTMSTNSCLSLFNVPSSPPPCP